MNPLDVSLSALEPTNDLGSASYNVTNGTLGWAEEPYAVAVLIDSGSDTSFISKRVAERLSGDRKLREAPPLRVRLANGETTLSTTILTTGITLGNFRARTAFRILDWDAYDVILGLDWLKQHNASWDFNRNRITVRNGSRKSSLITLRPYRTLDYKGLQEVDLNIMSYRRVEKALRTPQAREAVLYLIRNKEQTKRDASLIPSATNRRLRRILQQYRYVFRSELPKQAPIEREVKHYIDIEDAAPINLLYYSLSKKHRDE